MLPNSARYLYKFSLYIPIRFEYKLVTFSFNLERASLVGLGLHSKCKERIGATDLGL